MGTLIDDLIARVLEVIEQHPLRIKKISKGFRFTATLLEDGSCGMCFSVYNQEPIDSCEYVRSVKSMDQLDIVKILQFAKDSNENLEKLIGISTLNAISQHILKEHSENYHFTFDTDPIDHIEFEETDRVVMIGGIKAFLPKLQELVEDFVVIDKRLNNTKLPYMKSLETTQDYLHQADIVLITGSAIANNTLETLLKWIKTAKEVAVVGPSAGFVPEPLFDRGVTIVSGMQVLEPHKVMNIIADDGGTPHFKTYCKKYNIFRKGTGRKL
ncbi:MAG: DUF364 domain-containing protein [Candidatus Helarchaeota archaeon]|nr:DUF364 domain-containing protein [Candidatus Helarchaeota archaeon]